MEATLQAACYQTLYVVCTIVVTRLFVNTVVIHSRQENVNNYPRQFIFVAPGDTLYFSRFVHFNYFAIMLSAMLLFAIRLSYYAICYRTAYPMIMLGDLVGLNSQFIFVAPGDLSLIHI